jgi:SAM-dependent methyltransferase
VGVSDFSHVGNFTGYMQVVFDQLTLRLPPPARILDVPAGNGLLGLRLRERGYEVVQADINAERPDYVHADMEQALPFADASFDAVLCLEGIEHVIAQAQLLGELARVARPGALIVISTPNLSNLYSRLSFLFSGRFYQFDPRCFRLAAPGEMVDKGHIAPLTVYHLGYLMAARGARLEHTTGDRYKKKVLAPLALLLWPLAAWSERRVERALPAGMRSARAAPHGVFFNRYTYLSRSLVALFRKDEKG